MEDLLKQASTSFAEESAKATLQKWEDRFVCLLIEKYGEYITIIPWAHVRYEVIQLFERVASEELSELM